jgi:hypothetical protein
LPKTCFVPQQTVFHIYQLFPFQRSIQDAFVSNKMFKRFGSLKKRILFICKKKEKTSKYKGVYWKSEKGKWYVMMCLKGNRKNYGGCFSDELEAAKRVNQLCKKFGIPIQNHGIDTNLVTQFLSCYIINAQYFGLKNQQHTINGNCFFLFPPKPQK